MKKILCLLITLFCLSSSSFAQADMDINSFRFGIFIKPAPSWFNAQNTLIETGGGTGFGGGLIVDYRLTDRYWLGTGLSFTNLIGSTSVEVEGEGDYDANFKLRYLELPITLKLKTEEIGYFTYFGQLGVVPSVPINARYDLERPNVDPILNQKANEQIIKFNFGLIIGGGAEYSLAGNTSLLAGIYYNHGFTRILKKGIDAIGTQENDNKVAGSHVGVRLGVMF